jgi:hypothetical protein
VLADLSAVNGWNDIDPCPGNNCGYRIGSGPEWNKVIDDYSGGVYNPHWGPSSTASRPPPTPTMRSKSCRLK